MALDNTVIDKAVEKKYTEFSAAIKTELQTKMSNHPDSIKYMSDYDKIQDMKQMFAKISNPSEE